MNTSIVSGILAGALAGVLWVCIALMVGIETTTVGLVGLIIVLGTVLVTTVVSGVVAKSVRAG